VLSPHEDAFQLPPDVHYLNCAYMSPLPRAVEEAGIRGIRRKRVPSGIRPEDFFQESDEVRSAFARLVGVSDPARIAILPSVSYGVAVAAGNVGPVRGRNLVVVRDQFPGNVYAWLALEHREGARVRFVDPPAPRTGTPGRGEGWSRRVVEAIDDRTAAVSLAPFHWTDGTRFDLEAIGERTREVGALLVVDGTQSVGAAPFPMDRVRPDALICASYKWLLGPYSVALGYFGERFDGGIPLEEGWITRAGSDDFRGLVDYRAEYAPGALRYDVGERSNFILLPMLLEGLRLVHEWGPKEVRAHCGRLTAELAGELKAEGFGVEEEGWRAAHILGVDVPDDIDREELREALEARSVQVSLRGRALRISPHLYNDRADVHALLDGVCSVRG